IADEQKLGFYWIVDLVELLGVYEQSRKQYPTFASFIPVIRAYLNDLSTNMTFKYTNYAGKFPKVVTTLPFVNGAIDIDTSTKELTIIFSRPLGTGWSFRFSDLGKEHYPIESIKGWDESNTQLTIRLFNLKPNWNYEMIIMGQGLRTTDGYPLEDVLFKFKTK
ncbi:MAG TPA: hypothetical protein VF622_02000, partial [Segetibacter sp.]